MFTPKFLGYMYPASYNEVPQNLKLEPNLDIRAVITPHGNYQECGTVFNEVYRRIPWNHIKRVIYIGILHESSKNIKVGNFSLIRFPYHTFLIDTVLKNKLITLDGFELDHENMIISESSFEVQLPYIVSLASPNTLILPIVVGKEVNLYKASEKLVELCDDQTLFIISTDLFHYGPEHSFVDKNPSNAREIIRSHDYENMKAIFDCSLSRFKGLGMCGQYNSLLWILMNQRLKLKPELLEYRTSGDSSPLDRDHSSISYAGVIYGKDDRNNNFEQIFYYRKIWTRVDYFVRKNTKIDLMQIARNNIASIPRICLILFDTVTTDHRFKTISHFQVFNTIRNLCDVDKPPKMRSFYITVLDQDQIIGRQGINKETSDPIYNFLEQMILQTINACCFDPQYPTSSLKSKENYPYLHISSRYKFIVTTLKTEKEIPTNKFWQNFKPNVHGVRLEYDGKSALLLPDETNCELLDMNDFKDLKDRDYYNGLAFETTTFGTLLKKMGHDTSWTNWVKGKVFLFSTEDTVG